MNFLVLSIIAVLVFGKCVNSVKIEFFRNRNFTDLNYESNSTTKCNNLPAGKNSVHIGSIRTDTCLLIYYYPNCGGDAIIKFDLNNTLGIGWQVRSFHICNKEIGGHQLRIDITNYDDFTKPVVLENYRDVCTCINVPQYVQNMTRWSINNYGNDFLAYYQADCSENKRKAEYMPAGFMCHGAYCMHYYKKTDSVVNTVYKIQSIGPDPNSKYFKTSCSQVPVNNQTEDSVCIGNKTKLSFLEHLLVFLS